MNAVRAKHTATLMRDGRVLIAGGGDSSATAQNSAEVYDRTTGRFTTVPPMNSPRKEQAAVLLKNGDVLLIGGVDAAGQVLASAELFDPSTNRFTFTTAAFPGTGTNMSTGRYEDSVTLLSDGRVLIAGGSDPTLSSTRPSFMSRRAAPSSVWADAQVRPVADATPA
jgi:Kelch motif/Galactose oxidase, central domain